MQLADSDSRFLESLKIIHDVNSGAKSVDTNRLEVLAMFDAYLGPAYDLEKKEAVIALQSQLKSGQRLLAQQLDSGSLKAEEYVDSFNRLLGLVFGACEDALGKEDFELLFGSALEEMQGYIDKQQFLACETAHEPASQAKFEEWREKWVRPPGKNLTVLVVDESQNDRQRFKGALESRGCSVVLADNGWSALSALRAGLPDMMLVDVAIPEITGFELVRMVHERKHTERLPVVMMCRAIRSDWLAEAASVGASAIFSKEFVIDAVLDRLQNAKTVGLSNHPGI